VSLYVPGNWGSLRISCATRSKIRSGWSLQVVVCGGKDRDRASAPAATASPPAGWTISPPSSRTEPLPVSGARLLAVWFSWDFSRSTASNGKNGWQTGRKRRSPTKPRKVRTEESPRPRLCLPSASAGIRKSHCDAKLSGQGGRETGRTQLELVGNA